MKSKTAALLLCPALLFGGQMLPVFAEESTTNYGLLENAEPIKNGEVFNFTVVCYYIDENGDIEWINSRPMTGIVGRSISIAIPDLDAYVYSYADYDSSAAGLKISGSTLTFSTSASNMYRLGAIANDSNVWLDGNICLYYDKDPNFQLQPGWNQISTSYHQEGTWFYCNNDLSFATGLQKIDGKEYYFFEDGHMAQSQMVQDGNDPAKAKFYSSSGALKTGWALKQIYSSSGEIFDFWYYANPNTGLLKYEGWFQDKGRWYYFKDFVMCSSQWVESNGEKYYMTNSGGMATSRWVTYTVWENGKNVTKSSYVDASGKMVKNQWVGKYWVNANGIWDASKTK